MRKMMSKKSVIASFVAIMASVVFIFGATRISAAKAQETVTPVATWRAAVEMTDYQLTEDKVDMVNGKNVLGTSLLASQTTSAGTHMTYGVSTAVDVIKSHYQVNLLQNTAKAFRTDFNTLGVRVYAHLTNGGSAYTVKNGGGGIRIYAANDTRESNSG